MNPLPNMDHHRIRCLICDTTFWTYESFRTHMGIHIEESTRYQCVYCCQSILSKESLVAHLQEHTEGLTTLTTINTVRPVRPQHFVTPDFSTFNPPPLQQKLTKKPQAKLFECALCTDKFTKRSYMSLHLREVHKKVKKERTEKYTNRPRVPEKWQRNVRSKLRNSGQDYVTLSGKLVPPRKLKPPCVSCRQNCNEKISEEARKKLFEKFWGLGNLQAQRHYVHKLMETIDYPGRQRKRVNRFSIVYNGVSHRVCHKFFLNTFCISGQFIQTINAKSNDGMLEGERRGVANIKRQIDTLKPPIVEFINQMPRHQSHCKSGEPHEYFEGTKTLLDLYKTFKAQQKDKGVKKCGSYDTFRNIFYDDFNISMYKSKKGRCDICERKKRLIAASQAVSAQSTFEDGSSSQFASSWIPGINFGNTNA